MKTIISRSETLKILNIALEQNPDHARDSAFSELEKRNYTEPQLFDAIEEHGKSLNLTSDQWLRIFQMYPSQVFRSRFDLARLLSENDQKRLKDHDENLKP